MSNYETLAGQYRQEIIECNEREQTHIDHKRSLYRQIEKLQTKLWDYERGIDPMQVALDAQKSYSQLFFEVTKKFKKTPKRKGKANLTESEEYLINRIESLEQELQNSQALVVYLQGTKTVDK